MLLELHAAPELDSYPGVVGQVLQNLVENALVHAFAGETAGIVRVAMSETADGQHVLLTVTDNGRGIPAELQERIWDPFFTTRRGEGGTGLGLHIVQQMVCEVLGGSIALHTPPSGDGCEFAVTIPKCAPLDSVETKTLPATIQDYTTG